MNIVAFVLVMFVLIVGVVEVFQSAWKSLVGWAFIALAVALFIQFCTTWSHTVHT